MHEVKATTPVLGELFLCSFHAFIEKVMSLSHVFISPRNPVLLCAQMLIEPQEKVLQISSDSSLRDQWCKMISKDDRTPTRNAIACSRE